MQVCEGGIAIAVFSEPTAAGQPARRQRFSSAAGKKGAGSPVDSSGGSTRCGRPVRGGWRRHGRPSAVGALCAQARMDAGVVAGRGLGGVRGGW